MVQQRRFQHNFIVVTQGGITMRKFLTILLILIYTAVYTPVFAAITTQTTTISKIENDIYGFEYKNVG